MPNGRSLSITIKELAVIQFSSEDHLIAEMPSVPRDRYLEMDWRAADKVAAWKLFKRWMTVIFVADQVPEERQWALILVVGGDEAYNRWDTLEDTVKEREKVDQVWDAFREKL